MLDMAETDLTIPFHKKIDVEADTEKNQPNSCVFVDKEGEFTLLAVKAIRVAPLKKGAKNQFKGTISKSTHELID